MKFHSWSICYSPCLHHKQNQAYLYVLIQGSLLIYLTPFPIVTPFNNFCQFLFVCVSVGFYFRSPQIMASRSSQPPAKKQRGGMGKPPAGGGGTKGKKRQGVLTVEQLEADSVSQLAAQYWRGDNTKPFSSQVIIKYKICMWLDLHIVEITGLIHFLITCLHYPLQSNK